MILQMSDFPEHLCALYLYGLNIALNLANLCAEVGTQITLCNAFITETTSLEVFLIQKALGTCAFFS